MSINETLCNIIDDSCNLDELQRAKSACLDAYCNDHIDHETYSAIKKRCELQEKIISGNRIISRHAAIVEGRQMELAGCTNTSCTLNCLRKDSLLVTRVDHNAHGSDVCLYYIDTPTLEDE